MLLEKGELEGSRAGLTLDDGLGLPVSPLGESESPDMSAARLSKVLGGVWGFS